MWDWFSLPRNGTELLQAWEGMGVSSHGEEHWLSFLAASDQNLSVTKHKVCLSNSPGIPPGI